MSDIEYFYSAHSAFAYLGSARFMEIANASGRRIIHRPIDLNKVVAAANPAGFRARSAAHRAYYFGREIERWAEFRGVAIQKSIPENHRNDTSKVNSMLIAGVEQGGNVDNLAHALLQAHWLDHADLANESLLAKIADEAGYDGANLLGVAQDADIAAIYAANTDDAIKRSVFGSPTYVVDGDSFYGQDHLELVERALDHPFQNVWA